MSVLKLLCVAALLTVVSAGCMSSHPGSASMAYVEIEGVSMDKVVMAAKAAFADEFFELTGTTESAGVRARCHSSGPCSLGELWGIHQNAG
jgi:hypothetical protein